MGRRWSGGLLGWVVRGGSGGVVASRLAKWLLADVVAAVSNLAPYLKITMISTDLTRECSSVALLRVPRVRVGRRPVVSY